MEEKNQHRVLRHAELTRSFHWLLILCYTGLFVTGWGSALNIRLITNLVGSFRNLSWLHIGLGVGLIGFTLCYVILAFERYSRFIDHITRFGRADWTWIKSLGRGRVLPEDEYSGKYRTGQKIFSWLMIISTLVMCVSGFILARYYGNLSPGQLYNWYYVHFIGAILILVLLLGHVLFSICLPKNKGLGTAMLINGYLDTDVAQRKFAGWFERLESKE